MRRPVLSLSLALFLCLLVSGCHPGPAPAPSTKQVVCNYVRGVMEDKNREIREKREQGGIVPLAFEKGYQWEVGTTSISGWTEEQKLKLCGETSDETASLLGSPSQARTASLALLSASDVELPVSFVWRKYNGADWTTPIQHQGECPTCVAHAAVAVLESLLKISGADPNLNPDLSEQFVWLRGGGKSCDEGWNIAEAAQFLVEKGVPDDECWPYDPEDPTEDDCCPDWQNRVVKAAMFRRLRDREEMKRSLVSNGPLLARFVVHRDIDCYQGGIYRQVLIDRRGGHAVAIVGYDDVDRCWIVKNSWGTGWLRIGYQEVGIDSRVYEIRLSDSIPTALAR